MKTLILIILLLVPLAGPGKTKDKVYVPVTVRDVPQAVKDKLYDAAGIPKKERHNYVIDHRIPLELEGTNDISNLQIQTKAAGAAKDKKEKELTAQVRAGKMTLAKAREIISQIK